MSEVPLHAYRLTARGGPGSLKTVGPYFAQVISPHISPYGISPRELEPLGV
jgi:hypothetical protein